MNILFLDQYGDLGGAQRCLLDVVQAARERGWHPHVALPAGGTFSEQLLARGVPVSHIPCGPFSMGHKTSRDGLRFVAQWPVLKRRIRALMAGCGADLLYVNGPRPLPAACAAARGRVPLLFHLHNPLGTAVSWLVGRSLRRTPGSLLVAGSRFVARPLMHYLPPERVRVVYLGVEDLSDPARPAAGSVRRAGVIGRIAAGKGQLVFLQAARMLEAELPQVRFLICGAPLFSDQEAQHYLDGLRRAAQGAHVELRGWQDDVRQTLSSLDLLVVPSLGDECTPRVILEAFSAGVPVVAFPSGGIPEIVRQDETGFLVEPRTAEALAACLRDLLVNRWDGVQQVAARARREWRERFTLARFQTRILEAMEELR